MKLAPLLFAATSAKVCNEYLLTAAKGITKHDKIASDIDFKKQFSVAFDLNLDGKHTDKPGNTGVEGWAGVLETGNMDLAIFKCGRNFASVWIEPDSVAKLFVMMCVDNRPQYAFSTADLGAEFTNKWATVSIDQVETPTGDIKISLSVNGQKQDISLNKGVTWQKELVNTRPVEFADIDFIAGAQGGYNGEAEAAAGNIRNVNYSTGEVGEDMSTCNVGPWDEWGVCDADCGGGTMERCRLLNKNDPNSRDCQKSGCNTGVCAFSDQDFDQFGECECPNGSWKCSHAACPGGQMCQRKDFLMPEMKCLPATVGHCTSSGDPHVLTYDGQWNHIYSVGTFVYTQFDDFIMAGKTTLSFNVLMETYPCGRVACTKGVIINYIDNEGSSYKIRVDNGGVRELTINVCDSCAAMSVADFKAAHGWRNPWNFYFRTHFGLEVTFRPNWLRVSVPYAMRDKLEGVCGDFDQNKGNDYTIRRDGQHNQQTGSMTGCSNSWRVTGTDGPTPTDLAPDIANCDHHDLCQNLFNDPFYQNCREKVDTKERIQNCLTDLCVGAVTAEQVENARIEIIQEFINECRGHLIDDNAVCNWRHHENLEDTCDGVDGAVGSVWSGCHPGCMLGGKDCAMGRDECPVNPFLPALGAGCACPEGSVVGPNGDCIDYDDCDCNVAPDLECPTDPPVTDPTDPPVDDDNCDPEPTQCLKIWIEGGAVTKGKQGKKASNAYWKCAKKKRNKLLGKKPKKGRRSADDMSPRNKKKCKWTDCKKAHLDGKTWDNFNEKAWKKCCRKNMKYMRKGK